MSARTKYQSVITADMVNSTHFPIDQTGKWLRELTTTLAECNAFEWSLKPEIYRGDSFQAVLSNPGEALRAAVLARAIMKSYSTKTDLRIAIGIGKTNLITDRAGTSDGEAFRLSGHLADNIRKQKARIGVALPIPSEPLDGVLDLLETLIEDWTVAQSEVITALLLKQRIKQISEQLSISQPAVSQRITASKWWALEHFLDTFPQHITLYNLKKDA
jgi:hypothetical protein